MRKLLYTLVLSALASVTACKFMPVDSSVPPLQQMKISETEVSNWAPESEMGIYVGTQLYDLIDGGAPQYLEKGLIKTGHQVIKGSDDQQVESYVYDFGTPAKALVMYKEMKLQIAGSLINDLTYPDSLVCVKAVMGGVTGYAHFSNYYFEINVNGFSDQQFAVKTLDLFLGLYAKKCGI
ncbi:MAG: hypothetical protein MUF22_00680 [Chitinispirillaceae bacterium]|jgi:hypothetical protein|nr:hypothetical protein [Chitinispirillaceae bacterium]